MKENSVWPWVSQRKQGSGREDILFGLDIADGFAVPSRSILPNNFRGTRVCKR